MRAADGLGLYKSKRELFWEVRMQSPFKYKANCFIVIAATVIAWLSTRAQQAQNSHTVFVTALTALASSADDLIANETLLRAISTYGKLVRDEVLSVFPASDEDHRLPS
jgi:hypothetical protein